MSIEISNSFVQQYKDNVLHLSQQKGSKLRGTVRNDPDIVGQNMYFERIGATAAIQRTTRHSDTPLVNTPHSRRMLTMADYEWADLVDSQDKLRLLISPESQYVKAATYAFGRTMDDIIIAAATANAYAGDDGGTVVAFPLASQALGSSYNTANDSGHLSIPKLIKIREMFELADVDEEEPKTLVVSPKQISDLLNTTQVTSSDYNTVKALMQGEIDTFMGFKFIRSTRLPVWSAGQSGLFGSTTSSANDRRCIAYAQTGIGLAIAEDVTTRISERADKGYSNQVYMRMSIAATRIEDVKVVEVDCTES